MHNQNKAPDGTQYEFSSTDGQVEQRRVNADGSVGRWERPGLSTSSPEAFVRHRRQLLQGGRRNPNTDGPF